MKVFPLIIAGLAGDLWPFRVSSILFWARRLGSLSYLYCTRYAYRTSWNSVGIRSHQRESQKYPQCALLWVPRRPVSVIIIWGVLASIGKVGVGSATTAIVAVQILTALVLDLTGLAGDKVPLCATKVVGAVIFIIGAYLLLKQPA